MALMRTANPALNARVFAQPRVIAGGDMTIGGTANKAGVLLLCVFATACLTWSRFLTDPSGASIAPLMVVGLVGGLVTGVVTGFKPQWSPLTAPAYALLEGLMLGGFSAMLEARYPGIAVQAVEITFGTLLALLLAYQLGWIQPTERFKLGVMAATGGILFLYVAQAILGIFGIHFATLNGGGGISILFSLAVCAVAALNLVLDFDMISAAATRGAPKYMEWYGAFALMVTLVWLYIEILRLLTKMRER